MRNNHAVAPLSWLIAFVRKAQPRYGVSSKVGAAGAGTAETPASMRLDPVKRMARPAPYANHQFHESDLRRAIGQVRTLIDRLEPAAAASFGGYVSFPVSRAASRADVPLPAGRTACCGGPAGDAARCSGSTSCAGPWGACRPVRARR